MNLYLFEGRAAGEAYVWATLLVYAESEEAAVELLKRDYGGYPPFYARYPDPWRGEEVRVIPLERGIVWRESSRL